MRNSTIEYPAPTLDSRSPTDEVLIISGRGPVSGRGPERRAEIAPLTPTEAASQCGTRITDDNFDAFRRELLEWHLSWDIRRESSDAFLGGCSCRIYDRVLLADFSFDAILGTRTHAVIKHAKDDYVGVALIVQGEELYSQGNLEALARPSELLIWDAMRPATFRSRRGTRLLNMLFPRSMVQQHLPNIDDLSCKKIGPENGNGLILASHVATVHRVIDQVPAENRPSVFRATLELVASCFRPDDLVKGKTGFQSAMLRTVESHVRETLFEPDFGIESVASHFRVTPRYIHRLFSSGGVSFTQWVRNERLARARRALASSSFSDESITRLAMRFGFCDSAHFSRAFKAKYGSSPMRFRKSAPEG